MWNYHIEMRGNYIWLSRPWLSAVTQVYEYTKKQLEKLRIVARTR